MPNLTERTMKMFDKVGCATVVVFALAACLLSAVTTCGLVWVVCWLLGWDFSIKVALAIWIVLLIAGGTFGSHTTVHK